MPDSRRITLNAIADIAGAVTASDVAIVVQHHISRLGFIGATCSSFRSAGALCVHSVDFSTMPTDFVAAFVEARLLPHDPVTRRARGMAAPFIWERADHDLLQDQQRQIERLRREAGIYGGCCSMVAERVGGSGSGGMLLNASGAAFRATSSVLTALQVISGQIFWKLGSLRASSAAEPASPPPVSPMLTEREKAVMSWVAAGKSSWEIGRILAISEHTVNSHIERAVTKLGAANRSEAVAKGIFLGLIAGG